MKRFKPLLDILLFTLLVLLLAIEPNQNTNLKQFFLIQIIGIFVCGYYFIRQSNKPKY